MLAQRECKWVASRDKFGDYDFESHDTNKPCHKGKLPKVPFSSKGVCASDVLEQCISMYVIQYPIKQEMDTLTSSSLLMIYRDKDMCTCWNTNPKDLEGFRRV